MNPGFLASDCLRRWQNLTLSRERRIRIWVSGQGCCKFHREWTFSGHVPFRRDSIVTALIIPVAWSWGNTTSSVASDIAGNSGIEFFVRSNLSRCDRPDIRCDNPDKVAFQEVHTKGTNFALVLEQLPARMSYQRLSS